MILRALFVMISTVMAMLLIYVVFVRPYVDRYLKHKERMRDLEEDERIDRLISVKPQQKGK